MSIAASARSDHPTHAPHTAYRAAEVAVAEAPLTTGTDRYLRAAAHFVAHRAAGLLRRSRPGSPVAGSCVVLLVGGGRNGADTLLAGAALARCGVAVHAALATDRPHGEAWREALAAGVRPVVAADLAAVAGRADLVIDGLTGIGATGPLRPRAAALLTPLLAAGPRGSRPFTVLAVDVPSGTGVDDGTLTGPVLSADATLTFTCLKGCLALPPARHLAGEVTVLDLGLPVPDSAGLAHRPDVAALTGHLPVPGAGDHKYTRGVVGMWAGSDPYPGAAVLACSAAARAGAGMVRLMAPRRVQDLVLAARPEVVPTDGRCQALVLGPGIDPADSGRAGQVRAVLARVLDEGAPAVVDAGALPLLVPVLAEGHGRGRAATCQVLTPHAGEAGALLTTLTGARVDREAVEAEPAEHARTLSRLTGATVLLKGATTLVASPEGSLTSVDSGPAWMATAGSGDVLAGILGALLAGAQARAEGDDEARTMHADGSDGAEGMARGGTDRGAALPFGLDGAVVRDLAALAVTLHARTGYLAAGCEPGTGTRGHAIVAMDLVVGLPAALTSLGPMAHRHR